MDSEIDKKPCRGRGRPRKKNNIQNLQIVQQLQPLHPSTSEGTNMNAVVCALTYGYNECLMRICAFFTVIDPMSPRNVNLKTISTMSRQAIKTNPTFFEGGHWDITFQNTKVSGYILDASMNINEQHDSFTFEMFAEESTVIENLNYWFGMEQHIFTIFKCGEKFMGIVKFQGKHFLYDPNFNVFTVNNQSMCMLAECFDISVLAQEIHRCLQGKDLSVCTMLCHLIAVSVRSSRSSIIAHTSRRTLPAEHTVILNDDNNFEDTSCGSSAKKRKCADNDASTPTILLTADWKRTSNENTIFLHVCSFFCVVDVNHPPRINLDAVLHTTNSIMATYPDFSIDNFDYLSYAHDGKTLLIYKIFGINNLNNELYEDYSFNILCGRTFVDNLNIWYAMGYHEKTVFQCGFIFFGILKCETKYYLLDPNECFYTGGDHMRSFTPLDGGIELSAYNNVADLADRIHGLLKIKRAWLPANNSCTLFGVNTLLPIAGSEDYITTDAPMFHRTSKVKAMVQMSTLLSDLNELNLADHRKRIREKYAVTQQHMNEAERVQATQKRREYYARKWKNMDQTEREEALRRMKEYSAKRWEDMIEEQREEVLEKMRNTSAKRWEDMTEAQREEFRLRRIDCHS